MGKVRIRGSGGLETRESEGGVGTATLLSSYTRSKRGLTNANQMKQLSLNVTRNDKEKLLGDTVHNHTALEVVLKKSLNSDANSISVKSGTH